MPIRRNEAGNLEMQCANVLEDEPHLATHRMVQLDGWWILPAVNPVHHMRFSRVNADFPLSDVDNQAIPTRVFQCKTCGYLEFYAGEIVDPNTWGRDG
jgi:hypothetical protein